MMRTRRHQRGIVAVVVALAILSLLAMAGLAIDAGHLVLNKSRLQSTVDAAALAAAKVLNSTGSNEGFARDTAEEIFRLNKAKFPDLLTSGIEKPEVEFSHTLSPFVVGSSPAEYVRVRVEGLSMSTTFLRVLGWSELSARASAVAGPSAPIENPCDLFPVAICADLNAGEPHWGYIPYPDDGNTVTPIKLASSASGTTLGPGNFQLIRLSGTGGNVVRRDCAGGSACPEPGKLIDVDPQPGNVSGPVAQGTNTRFGQYGGGLARSDYPPDCFTTPNPTTPLEAQAQLNEEGQTVIAITYDGKPYTNINQLAYSYKDYLADYRDLKPDVCPKESFRRRVVTVPIVDCSHPVTGTSGTLPIKGYGCFLLLQPVRQGGTDTWIFGQFIDDCPGSGNPGGQGGEGPYTIVLHNDPDSHDS